MSSSDVSVLTCLPITALHSINLGSHVLLLAGQGPHLHVWNTTTNRRLETARIFNVQNIHGIEHAVPPERIDSSWATSIAVFGGSHFAIVSLAIEPTVLRVFVRDVQVCQSSEWILRARYIQPSDDAAYPVLLTANNLLSIASGSGRKGDVLQLKHIGQGPKSALYSGDICYHREESVLVAGGSVFGEVLVWECRREEGNAVWVSGVLYRFQGHRGSVFGVYISPELKVGADNLRLVASCSDDRTIQVWNITGRERHEKRTSSQLLHTQGTGFGGSDTSDSLQVASASGHASRIWDVAFVGETNYPDSNSIRLLSRGEDATCKTWSLALDLTPYSHSDPARLVQEASDHHHFGKNVLAWTVYEYGTSKVLASGGADGRVVKRRLRLLQDPAELFLCQPFISITADTNSKALKDYLFTDQSTIISLTSSGKLLRGQVSDVLGIKWELQPSASNAPFLKFCSNMVDGVLIISVKDGLWVSCPDEIQSFVPLALHQPISWMRVLSIEKVEKTPSKVILLITLTGAETAILLSIESGRPENAARTTTMNLPRAFIVTSACYETTKDLILLGSRTGSIAIYHRQAVASEVAKMATTHQIHGTDAVTSLQTIWNPNTGLLYALSTGRDGACLINRLQYSDASGQWKLSTVHRSSPPFAMNTEGAIMSSSADSGRTEVLLFGFRSTEFVVWNHTIHTEVFAVDCGGAHRSWAYHFAPSVPAEHALVWTKASKVNYLKRNDQTPIITQEGGHGREIKALAIRRATDPSEPTIIATGAEDTTIRLFSVPSTASLKEEESNSFIPLMILSDHTTGIQNLHFSDCGMYLFSSGGNGQLYTWIINDEVPIFGLGGILLDKMPQADDDLDARILDFVVVPGDTFSILAAYSNGKVRVMDYTPGTTPGAGIFTPKTDVLYGTFCLMQVQIHTWPDQRRMVLAAGTNGRLNVTPAKDLSLPARTETHAVHQSSILAMDYITLDSTRLFIATGGDDNALGLTLLSTIPTNVPLTPTPLFRTLLVPKAHAAALTALKIVYSHQCSGVHHLILVTAGNDQRIKVWRISIPEQAQDTSLDDVQVLRLYQGWTCVADVSNIDLLAPVQLVEGADEVGFQVVVVGIGMEVLRLTANVGPGASDRSLD